MMRTISSALGDRGLTLLEVIIAIGIILFGFASAMILLAESYQAVRGAENYLVAAQLAQEAIEVVVNIRDSNWIEGNQWDTNIPETTAGIVDYNSTAVSVVGSSRFCIRRNGSNIYLHGTAATCNTPFLRHLEIENFGNYKEISAIVSWSEPGGRTPSITVVHHLYDWR
jgi:type II secretory pathway pseudopilin PulG